LQAALNAARAATAAYRVTHDTNVELDQYEAVGRNEVAVSAANLGRAQAEATAVAAQMTDCSVHAPFAGTVVERIANVREVAASGQPLLRIQSGRDVELELIVPSRWLTWLQPGATFAFVIDETGNTIRGRVTRFGASVDPVSRTIRVTSVVTEHAGLVLPGMSGTANFDDPRARLPVGASAPVQPVRPPVAG
jgi:membrane fusion protein, multidrug efflux system